MAHGLLDTDTYHLIESELARKTRLGTVPPGFVARESPERVPRELTPIKEPASI
jgi:hypothetical protein